MTIKKQNQVLFEPVKLAQDYTFTLPPGVREIEIPVEQFVKLNGFLFESKGAGNLIVYFQGNAKNLQNWLDNHNMVLDWGCNVLVTDYRGFGKSEGEVHGQAQMEADAEKVFDYALHLGYKPENIIIYGYSMGTGIACHLATARKAKALILESPYSSIAEMAWVENKAPAYIFDNKGEAKSIEIPTLIIHGDKDTVILPDHAQRIFDNLKTTRKKLVILPGGGHGDLRKRPEYKKLITEFVDGCATLS
jgi:pimeloyl-ACP methyl ester carboxylesterase